uniref:Uncharacterized protein n=1 Tax=Timema shepardi TaxID=629360 RepID=A0A7R9G3J1_TIMSH|nr:unnamed protein product [Timema shepardi]
MDVKFLKFSLGDSNPPLVWKTHMGALAIVSNILLNKVIITTYNSFTSDFLFQININLFVRNETKKSTVCRFNEPSDSLRR